MVGARHARVVLRANSRVEYLERRDTLLRILRGDGVRVEPDPPARTTSWPTSRTSGSGTTSSSRNRLTKDVGVAVVPGSSFFSRPELGAHLVRFAFCKKLETLEEAGARLRKAFA